VGDEKQAPVPHLSVPSDAVHWRTLAQEVLTAAALATEADAQQAMLALAVAYERLAQHADKREAPEGTSLQKNWASQDGGT
jgi:hypothetical protein